MYVAVVCRGVNHPVSGGSNGGWSSFIDPDKDVVVTKALDLARTLNEKQTSTAKKYVVLVGELTQVATIPVTYELVSIPEPAPKVAVPAPYDESLEED